MKRVLLTCMVLLCLLVTGCRRIRTGSVAMNGHKINLHDMAIHQQIEEDYVLEGTKEDNQVTIILPDDTPNDVEIKAELLDLKGNPLYEGQAFDLSYERKGETITFAVDPDLIAALSSDSTIQKHCLFGYHVVSKALDKEWLFVVKISE